jgi:hypothetical protein
MIIPLLLFPIRQNKGIPLLFILLPLFSILTHPAEARSDPTDAYKAVTGLIDIRSTFSDGIHSIEEIVQMAESRGFNVVFISDHNRVAISYGILPFRNILRYKKENPSIMSHGPGRYLHEIEKVSRKHPHMIIIPGCVTSTYYYWTGSWWNKNLSAHEYHRRILAIDLTEPEDYAHIPDLGNGWSLRYTKELLPGFIIFLIPFFISLVLLRQKGFFRHTGVILTIISALAIVDYNPFRSSLYNAYDGDQGIAPFQELIDYVNEKGGLCFWNYPEQKSGMREYGPIHLNTPPYPEVLYQSQDYTGFSAIYGENPTVTDPGKEWDRVLNEYCQGQRRKPSWGISTAEFHEDGRWGLQLGIYPTTLLVKDFSKDGIMEAIQNGRMYCSRGDGQTWPKLDYFNVYGENGMKAFMGDTLRTSHFPIIAFKISDERERKRDKETSIYLIRGGTLIHTFKGKTPMEIEYTDETAPSNEKTFYRLIDREKHLTSNPIFVVYRPNRF